MNTDAQFIEKIFETYTDPNPWLVFSDWLQEQGREGEAYAYHWCGRTEHFPGIRHDRKRLKYFWYRDGKGSGYWKTSPHHRPVRNSPWAGLPQIIYRACFPYERNYVGLPGFDSAMWLLVEGMSKIKRALGEPLILIPATHI